MFCIQPRPLRGKTIILLSSLLWILFLMATPTAAWAQQGALEIYSRAAGYPTEQALLNGLEPLAEQIREDLALSTDGAISDATIVYASGYAPVSVAAIETSAFEASALGYAEQFENYILLMLEYAPRGGSTMSIRTRLDVDVPFCAEWSDFDFAGAPHNRIIPGSGIPDVSQVTADLIEVTDVVTRNLCCGARRAGAGGGNLSDGTAGTTGARSSSQCAFPIPPWVYRTLLERMLLDPEFIAAIEEINSYISLIPQECFDGEDGFKQLPGRIIPDCWWRENSMYIPYHIGDRAFTSGIADGIYGEIKGLVDLVVAAPSAMAYLRSLTFAYTLYYISCDEAFLRANTEDIAWVADELLCDAEKFCRIDLNDAHKGDLFVYYKSTSHAFASEAIVALFSGTVPSIPVSLMNNRCEEWYNQQQDVKAVMEFMFQGSSWESAYNSIKDLVLAQIDSASSFDNSARYQHGRIVGFTATLFVGVGEVSSFAKTLRAARAALVANPLRLPRAFAKHLVDNVILGAKRLHPAHLQKLTDDLASSKALRSWMERNKEVGVRAWEKLANVPGSVAAALRKRPDVLSFISRHGDDVPQSAIDDLVRGLDKPIEDIAETVGGRLTITTTNNGGVRSVVALEKTSSGKFVSTKYQNAYNKHTRPGMPPLGPGKIAPDFSGNSNWLYPITGSQKNIVKVRLTGKRRGVGGDFEAANQAAGFPTTTAPTGYSWHHLDNFDPATGEATFQLVKKAIHQSTAPHTGSVKQWEVFSGQTYGS